MSYNEKRNKKMNEIEEKVRLKAEKEFNKIYREMLGILRTNPIFKNLEIKSIGNMENMNLVNNDYETQNSCIFRNSPDFVLSNNTNFDNIRESLIHDFEESEYRKLGL